MLDKINTRRRELLDKFKSPDLKFTGGDFNEYLNNLNKEGERIINRSNVRTAANKLREEVNEAHDIKHRKLIAAEDRLIKMKRKAALKKLKLGVLGSIAAGVGTGFAANHYLKNKEKKK